MTEEELRSAVSRSQKDGFKVLFQQYKSYVYSIVWGRIRTVGSAEDAEECVSDVFADVFLHFDEITAGSLKSYIGTAAKRTAIDRFRRLSADRAVPTDEEQLLKIPSDSDIHSDLEDAEKNNILYEAVRSLGEPDASIIIQKYYYDRTSKEIAEVVGMTPVAVRVRLNRAIKHLRKLLTEDYFTKG